MTRPNAFRSTLASLATLIALTLPAGALANGPVRPVARHRVVASATRTPRVEHVRSPRSTRDGLATRGVFASLGGAPTSPFAAMTAPPAPAAPRDEAPVATSAGAGASNTNVPATLPLRGHNGTASTGYGVWVTWEVVDRPSAGPRLRPSGT